MATIKSYTDLEQSKRLAEILPLESADMDYIPVVNLKGEYAISVNEWDNDHILDEDWIPCWSLAALLGVLPKGYSLGRRINGKYYVCMTCVKHDVIECDNPVDACYEMILKLNKLKIL